MKTKETILNLVSSIADLELSDDDDNQSTDNDILQSTSVFMLKSHANVTNMEEKNPDDIIEVKAHFEYSMHPEYQDKVYAISDGGADSSILGKLAKVISYTGRYASLVGYDPHTTRTEKVPIVSAYIKARSSSIGNYPVLLKVNEAPYNPNSPITLLSEYQIREYGLVIDSVAKKHKSSHGKQGTQ